MNYALEEPGWTLADLETTSTLCGEKRKIYMRSAISVLNYRPTEIRDAHQPILQKTLVLPRNPCLSSFLHFAIPVVDFVHCCLYCRPHTLCYMSLLSASYTLLHVSILSASYTLLHVSTVGLIHFATCLYTVGLIHFATCLYCPPHTLCYMSLLSASYTLLHVSTVRLIGLHFIISAVGLIHFAIPTVNLIHFAVSTVNFIRFALYCRPHTLCCPYC